MSIRKICIIGVSSLTIFANSIAQETTTNTAETFQDTTEKPVGYYRSQADIFNPVDQSALSFQDYQVFSSSNLRHLFEEPEAPYSTSLPLEYQLNYSQPSRQFEFGTMINDARTAREILHLNQYGNCGEDIQKQMEVLIMISAPIQDFEFLSCQDRDFKLPDDLHEAVESP